MRTCSVFFLLNQFTGHKLQSEFHEHVNFLREMSPVSDKKTWAMWIKENHSKCVVYNTQQCKNLYFGHWLLLNCAKLNTARRHHQEYDESVMGAASDSLWSFSYRRYDPGYQEAFAEDSPICLVDTSLS